MGASKSVLLAAWRLTYHIAGSLDFVAGGLLAGANASATLLAGRLFLLSFRLRQGGRNADACWPRRNGSAHAGQRAPACRGGRENGRLCVLRVIFHVFGVGMVGELGLGIATAYLVSFTILMASVYALTRDDLKARLAYSTVSQLSYIVLGRGTAIAAGDGRRHHPHRGACILQDHALFLRGIDLLWRPENAISATWPAFGRRLSLDDGGILRRVAEH